MYVDISAIIGAGSGLFTMVAREKGDAITSYHGPLAHKDDAYAMSLRHEATHATRISGSDFVILGATVPVDGIGGASFANHQRGGDCNAVFVKKGLTVFLEATKPIKAHEEVFAHYGNDPRFAMGLCSEAECARCWPLRLIKF